MNVMSGHSLGVIDDAGRHELVPKVSIKVGRFSLLIKVHGFQLLYIRFSFSSRNCVKCSFFFLNSLELR